RFSSGVVGVVAPSGCSDCSVWKGTWSRSSLTLGASSITCQFFPTGTARGLGGSMGVGVFLASNMVQAQRRKKPSEHSGRKDFMIVLLILMNAGPAGPD